MQFKTMQRFLATSLSSMKRIFAAMVVFGLAIGLIFPFVVDPFVTWKPEYRIYFRLSCLVAGFAVGAFSYQIIKISLFRQKLALEQAKDSFTLLTQTAIRERDWSVDPSDPEIPTCWQVKNCNQSDCPVYGKHHMRCWLIAGTFCDGEIQGRFAQKLATCTDCDVYAGAVKQDPIREIGESFNGLMWEVSEREKALAQANDQLQEMAVTDFLTGLKNHGVFQDQLEREVARAKRFQQTLSVIMIDLDHFKNVNDKFGHQMGDTVLKSIGRLLTSDVRKMDFSARYGGEEFVIILPETTGASAMDVAEKLRVKIKEQVAAETGLPTTYVGASFGVGDYPRCATDRDGLIAAADSALLFSKRKGRNQVSYFLDLTNTDLSQSDIDELSDRLGGAGLKTISALAEAVNSSDGYSATDSQQITDASRSVAAALGMSEEQTESLILATKLHDIGKVGIPDSILSKKEALSADEISMVRQHPAIGQRILHEATAVKDVISAILYHHENWDGSGYPEQLKGEDIPVMARAVSIADAYRAMTSDRPYRKALTPEQAIAQLRQGAGKQFDPTLVGLFIQALERHE